MQYDTLPLILNANDLSKILGISKSSCYKLFQRKDFPTILIGNRKLVARDHFWEWLDQQTKKKEDSNERTQ